MARTTTAAVEELEALTPPSTVTAAAELDERVQKLPQELQDWIKELLIAPDLTPPNSTANLIRFDKTWKPPLGLQIDRKTRETFAKEYYKVGFTYQIAKHTEPARHRDRKILIRKLDRAYDLISLWLANLNQPHQELVKTIRVEIVLIGAGPSYVLERSYAYFFDSLEIAGNSICKSHPNLVRRGGIVVRVFVVGEGEKDKELKFRGQGA